MIGDFNAVVLQYEKNRGRLLLRMLTQEFSWFVEKNDIMDATDMGLRFSWCKERRGYFCKARQVACEC